MRRWIMCLCFALAAPCVAFAQQKDAPTQTIAGKRASGTADQNGVAALLETKVKAAWSAFKNRDGNAYAEFLTDDFQAVEADGDG